MDWRDVRRVIAYKRDMLGYDLVCLRIEVDGEPLEIDEDALGWGEVLEQLPRSLPGAADVKALYPKIVQPAFEPNEMLVFSREDPGPGERGPEDPAQRTTRR